MEQTKSILSNRTREFKDHQPYVIEGPGEGRVAK